MHPLAPMAFSNPPFYKVLYLFDTEYSRVVILGLSLLFALSMLCVLLLLLC